MSDSKTPPAKKTAEKSTRPETATISFRKSSRARVLVPEAESEGKIKFARFVFAAGRSQERIPIEDANAFEKDGVASIISIP